MPPRLAVCSWSLQPASPEDLAEKVRACGLDLVQLALDPIRRGEWALSATRRALAGGGVGLVSGMIAFEGEDYSTLESIRATGGLRPDAHWERNLAAANDGARIAAELGLTLVTFHAGFIPEDHADPERAVMLDRVARVAGVFHARGVRVALETGQETAGALLDFLRSLDAAAPSAPATVGVNFDPANMLLYGMGDPVAALQRLARRVAQFHVKDAIPSAREGRWGTETRAGAGAVDWPRFFEAYHAARLACDLVVERESGDTRIDDAIAAARLVRSHVPSLRGSP